MAFNSPRRAYLFFHFPALSLRRSHFLRRIILSSPPLDPSFLDEPAYRGLKHPQTALADFGGAQTSFLDPSIDRPLTDLQQLGRFLDAK